eukprot:1189103-Prorocentrum_minimum.AAC.3
MSVSSPKLDALPWGSNGKLPSPMPKNRVEKFSATTISSSSSTRQLVLIRSFLLGRPTDHHPPARAGKTSSSSSTLAAYSVTLAAMTVWEAIPVSNCSNYRGHRSRRDRLIHRLCASAVRALVRGAGHYNPDGEACSKHLVGHNRAQSAMTRPVANTWLAIPVHSQRCRGP